MENKEGEVVVRERVGEVGEREVLHRHDACFFCF